MGWQELCYLTLPRLVLIGGLLALPLIMPGMYWPRVITIVCIYALLALSFDFLAHFVGLVSLGGAFFIGTGGYIAAILNTSYGMSPMLTVPIATLVGAVICTILLLPCLPLRGVYFAIVTLMYPLVLARIIEALDIFGGTDGILGVDGFPNAWLEQYVVIIVLLLFLFGVRRLVNQDIGLVFRAVKDNDQAVRASGMNVNTYKAAAVFIASAIGMFRRRLPGPHLHVGRDLAFRLGFFHPAHRGHRHRRRRNARGTCPGLPDSGPHIGTPTGIRDPSNCFLFIDSGWICRFSKRRNHGVRRAKISSV